jgi:hypothetical protein
VVNATPRLLYPRKENPCPFTEGWVSPKAGLDVCEKSRPCRASIPGPAVANRDTGYAIPAHEMYSASKL